MSTLTRRERREQERARRERPAGAPGQQRPRRGPRPLWTAVIVVVALAALVGAGRAFGVFGPAPKGFDVNAAQYAVAGATIGTHEPDEGNAHVPYPQTVTYKQDPPTSGSHWAQPNGPVPWGVKDVTQPNEAIVHNLEHGGIVLFYKSLSDADVVKLKDLVRELRHNGYNKIVLEPYPRMADAGIALSAWDWSLKLQGYDEAQIVKFVKAHYQGPDAPEPQAQ